MFMERSESSELTGAGDCSGILFRLKIGYGELFSIALIDRSRSEVKVEEVEDESI